MSALDYPGPLDRPLARIGAGWARNVDLLRLGAALFIFPCVLFAFSLGPIAAAALLAGCALGWLVIWRGGAESDGAFLATPIDAPTLAGCAALAIALCLLGGETHLFYANTDWLFRDAVLADLVRQGFPTFYQYQGEDYLLRAPLGMYMTPALVGRYIGLQAAHVALLAQNAAIVALALYLFAQLARVNKVAFVVLFVAFSGLDIVGTLFNALADYARSGELVAPERVEGWNKYLHYSGHVRQIFWAPNHALPGWWLAILTLLHARREINFATLLVALAALAFWSPMAAVGASPFVVYVALRSPLKELLTLQNLRAADACLLLLPMAIYVSWDAGSITHGWLLGEPEFVWSYVYFVALALPQAAIVAGAWNKVETGDRAIFVIAVAVLLLLPIYRFGPFNDLVMRASIPALAILAFAFARVATLVPRDAKPIALGILVVVVASAATPALQIKRAVAYPAYAISDCNFLTSWSKLDPERWPTNYLARASNAPSWLVPMNDKRLALEDRICWPGNPLMGDKAR